MSIILQSFLKFLWDSKEESSTNPIYH